ncbi:MAG: hypothetical protein WCD89_13235 [Anaerocolumna sp.]
MNGEELRKRKDKGPYEHLMDNRFSMYDKTPYMRDITLCGTDTLNLISGNIIKFYRCKIVESFNIMPDKLMSDNSNN